MRRRHLSTASGHPSSDRQVADLGSFLPLGLRCCKLGTLGSFDVQSSCRCCFPSTRSFATFRLDRRDSPPGFFPSDRGAPTCLTDEAGIADEPLLGGTGGFEEECRRWWACEVMEPIDGVAGRDGTGEPFVQVRATRRSDELNIDFNTNTEYRVNLVGSEGGL